MSHLDEAPCPNEHFRQFPPRVSVLADHLRQISPTALMAGFLIHYSRAFADCEKLRRDWRDGRKQYPEAAQALLTVQAELDVLHEVLYAVCDCASASAAALQRTGKPEEGLEAAHDSGSLRMIVAQLAEPTGESDPDVPIDYEEQCPKTERNTEQQCSSCRWNGVFSVEHVRCASEPCGYERKNEA